MNNFLFLGGDLRSVYAAGRLNKQFDTFIYGFDELDMTPETPVLREIGKHKSLVLPLPSSIDGQHINAPYSKFKIKLSAIPEAVEPGGTVYCGKASPELKAVCEENGLPLIDYFEREELAVMNAVPTAEGALGIVMSESSATVFGMNILITGHGRITKVLIKQLTALGAVVTVAARKYSDLSWAEIMGCKPLHISKMNERLGEFETIINTVPSPIFGKNELSLMKKDCLIVDLASKSGIEDMEAAARAGIKVKWALSLPRNVSCWLFVYNLQQERAGIE